MNSDLKKTIKDFLPPILVMAVAFVIALVLAFMFPDSETLHEIVFALFGLIIMGIFAAFFSYREKVHKKKMEKGNIKYAPMTISKERFMEECKVFIPPSFIRINGKVYGIFVAPGDDKEGAPENFACYLDDNEITGLDNFLDYKYDGEHCLRELEKIEFLEVDGEDPQKQLGI